MERLSLERVVAGVEEGGHGRGVAEMAPGRLHQLALPSRLLGGHLGMAAFAKCHRPTRLWFCRRLIDRTAAHVTDPGSARPAPSASRVRPICSAISRAN